MGERDMVKPESLSPESISNLLIKPEVSITATGTFYLYN
jgi:hypothetical protein